MNCFFQGRAYYFYRRCVFVISTWVNRVKHLGFTILMGEICAEIFMEGDAKYPFLVLSYFKKGYGIAQEFV